MFAILSVLTTWWAEAVGGKSCVAGALDVAVLDDAVLDEDGVVDVDGAFAVRESVRSASGHVDKAVLLRRRRRFS